MNHKIKILIKNMDTADEVEIETYSESLRAKLNIFKRDIFDDALNQVLDNKNDRQNLKDKNAEFNQKHGPKKPFALK